MNTNLTATVSVTMDDQKIEKHSAQLSVELIAEGECGIMPEITFDSSLFVLNTRQTMSTGIHFSIYLDISIPIF